jgi:hypothetical protein
VLKTHVGVRAPLLDPRTLLSSSSILAIKKHVLLGLPWPRRAVPTATSPPLMKEKRGVKDRKRVRDGKIK